MKRIGIIALFLAAVFILSGCFSLPDDTSASTTAATEQTSSKKAGIGETSTGEDWEATLMWAKAFPSIVGDYYTDTPAEGKEYLVCFFEIKNISDSDSSFTAYNVNGYVDDVSADRVTIMNSPDWHKSLYGDVAAGRKLQGCIIWEVPKDWKTFSALFNEELLFSNYTMEFEFSHSEVETAAADTDNPSTTVLGTDDSKTTVAETETIPLSIGDTINGNNWTVTLTSAKLYTSIADDYYTDTPDDGKVYLVCFFEVKNVSSKDSSFGSFYFEAYVDDYSVDTAIIMNKPDNKSLLYGDVAAGKKLSGYTVYEIPKDFAVFSLLYNDSIYGSNHTGEFIISAYLTK